MGSNTKWCSGHASTATKPHQEDTCHLLVVWCQWALFQDAALLLGRTVSTVSGLACDSQVVALGEDSQKEKFPKHNVDHNSSVVQTAGQELFSQGHSVTLFPCRWRRSAYLQRTWQLGRPFRASTPCFSSPLQFQMSGWCNWQAHSILLSSTQTCGWTCPARNEQVPVPLGC